MRDDRARLWPRARGVLLTCLIPACVATPTGPSEGPAPAAVATLQQGLGDPTCMPIAAMDFEAGSLGEILQIAPQPLTAEEGNPPPPSGNGANGAVATTFTITGGLFYNDLRNSGRWNWRRTLSGAVGSQMAYSSTAANYLGALDVVADIYEIDPATDSSRGCAEKSYVGGATVGPDGSFSATVTVSEGCQLEADTTPDIAISFRLRFCNSTRCFSVVKDDGSTIYRLWVPGATVGSPRSMPAGTHGLGNYLYQASFQDVYSQAANVFASGVEVTRVFHRDGGVPFAYSTLGEVNLEFPDTSTSVATTVSASRVKIPMPSTWIDGSGVMHEFGHVIHSRAWGGTTGACGDCPNMGCGAGDAQYSRNYAVDGSCSWGRGTLEYPHPAFTEGWANFAARATADTCADLDINDSTNPIYPLSPAIPGIPDDGKSYAGNVTKILCDWYDSAGDNDTTRPGAGDHFVADSLYSVWYNLANMYPYASDTSGLSICNYIDYYVNGRKGVAAVGTSTHDYYYALIADLAYQNGIKCGLEQPSGM